MNNVPLHPWSIQNLEVHVCHSCNLTCDSCAHYSNHGHKGILSVEEADRWMKAWNRRLQPAVFSLVGGEPTIHPQLAAFAEMTGSNFPRSVLRLLTNGFFLHRHPDLPAVLARYTGYIEISVHSDDPEYLAKLAPVVQLARQWQEEFSLPIRWTRSFGMWTRRYQGWGSQMKPFADGAPQSSWQKCRARASPQLFEGKVWKCPALAYLRMQKESYQLGPEWDDYLAYQPLDPGCSQEELEAFFARRQESYCGMCPADPERFRMASPLIPVAELKRNDRARSLAVVTGQ